MDTQLDKIEKLVGIWNPLNRYLTVYQALDALCEKVDNLNISGQIELMGSKAKELNSQLETFVNRFRTMKDINYQPSKLDFLVNMIQ